MSLTYEEPRWPSAFDHIECPVCGSEDWHQLPMEGVFCTDCNCQAALRSTMGDQGFIVDFDSSTCWVGDSGPSKSSRIPYAPRVGEKAFAKYRGSEEDGYTREYLSVSAFVEGDAEPSEWSPAWKRGSGGTAEA